VLYHAMLNQVIGMVGRHRRHLSWPERVQPRAGVEGGAGRWGYGFDVIGHGSSSSVWLSHDGEPQ
jgi:hypothetical protein